MMEAGGRGCMWMDLKFGSRRREARSNVTVSEARRKSIRGSEERVRQHIKLMDEDLDRRQYEQAEDSRRTLIRHFRHLESIRLERGDRTWKRLRRSYVDALTVANKKIATRGTQWADSDSDDDSDDSSNDDEDDSSNDDSNDDSSDNDCGNDVNHTNNNWSKIMSVSSVQATGPRGDSSRAGGILEQKLPDSTIVVRAVKQIVVQHVSDLCSLVLYITFSLLFYSRLLLNVINSVWKQLAERKVKETKKIIHVCDLVRPYTLRELKSLLARTGTLVDGGFWIDENKWHCFATYETEEQAEKTRQSLHGARWPVSSPKSIRVEYATKEQLEFHLSEDELRRIEREKVREKEREERAKTRAVREKEHAAIAVCDNIESKERDEHFSEIVKLREGLNGSQERQNILEQQHSEASQKIQELQQEIQIKENKAQRETRKNNKLERELRLARSEQDSKASEIQTLQTQIEAFKSDISKCESTAKEQRVQIERQTKDSDILNTRFTKLQADYENQIIQCDNLNSQNHTKTLELKMREEEVNNLKTETQRLTKVRETIQRKLRTIEDAKSETEQQREILKSEITALERELGIGKKQAEADKKSIEELIRERDILHKNLLKAASQTKKQITMVKLHEQSKKNLDQEILNYKEEATKQRKIIYHLEKERDCYINEASDLTQKVLQHIEDVKVREMQIFDYKKKIGEAELKMENAYQFCLKDMNYNEKIKELTRTFIQEMEFLKNKNQVLKTEKEKEETKHEKELYELMEKRAEELQDLESANQKLMRECGKFQELQAKIQKMQEDYQRQLQEMDREKALEQLTECYDTRLEEMTTKLEQAHNESRQQNREYEETKRKIEEDADREILHIKNKYERRHRDEKQASMKLKKETNIMRKKFTSLQNEIEDHKEEIKMFPQETAMLNNAIRNLENVIQELKKEIQERDETTQDKETPPDLICRMVNVEPLDIVRGVGEKPPDIIEGVAVAGKPPENNLPLSGRGRPPERL